MFGKSSFALLASAFVLGAVAPVSADSGPIDPTQLTTAELRALFHSPPFTAICPLAVYDEDYRTLTADKKPEPGVRHAGVSRK